jgi:hypothetical protein
MLWYPDPVKMFPKLVKTVEKSLVFKKGTRLLVTELKTIAL